MARNFTVDLLFRMRNYKTATATPRTHQCQGSQCTDTPLPSEKIEEGTSVHRLSQGGDEVFICFEWRFQGIKRRLGKPSHKKEQGLRKQPFFLAPRRWRRFARRNVATQRQIFHTDDVKSVRNPVITADWRRSSSIVLAIVYEWQTTIKRLQRSNVNAMDLTKQFSICGIYSFLEEAFDFCWSSFADEHNTLPKSTKRNVKLNKFAFGTARLPNL